MNSEEERTPLTYDSDHDDLKPRKSTAVYKRRWYVLGVYCYCAVFQATIWNTWGPITETTKVIFGWTDSNIALVMNLSNIAFIIMALPVCMLMERKGLRLSMLMCSVMFIICTGLRCITLDSKALLGLSYTCACIFGTAAIVPFAGPSFVSAVWFPLDQRTTATAISSTFNYLGLALSFLLGPLIVTNPEYGSCIRIHNNSLDEQQNHITKLNASTIEREDAFRKSTVPAMGDCDNDERVVININILEPGVQKLMFIYLGLSSFLFILTLIYFPAKPPKPPSYTASIQRPDYKEASLQLLKNKNLWLVVISGGLPTGVLSCWGAILDVNIGPIGVKQTDAGWIGFWHIISGCVSGLITARFSDMFIQRKKTFLIALYILSTVSCVWFTLLYNDYIVFNLASMYASCILLGAFANATIPLWYEISCEVSYPVAEGVTGGFFTLVHNIFGTIFLFVLNIESIGVAWMNWFLLGSFLLCIPIFMMFPEQLKRTNLDLKYQNKC